MITVAVAQTTPVGGDVEANAEQHLRLARVAAEAGARVLVFPELSLTGYEIELADRLAFSLDDGRLAPLVDVSAAHALTLIVGAPVRLGGALHIGALILSPDRTTSLYTKRHLGAFSAAAAVDGIVPPAEGTAFQAGTHDPLVELDGVPAALAVCADSARPSHAQAAARRGARLYLASMFVIPSEYDRDAERLRRVALGHRMGVAMANYGGPSGGLRSGGRSAIWSDTGELVSRLEHDGIGVAVAARHGQGWRGAAIRC